MTLPSELDPEVAGGIPLPVGLRLGSATLLILQLRTPEFLEGKWPERPGGASLASVCPVAAGGSLASEEVATQSIWELLSTDEVLGILASILDGSGAQTPAGSDSTDSFGVANPSKIAIRSRGKIIFMAPSDVITVEGRGNYVLLRTSGRSHLVRESVSVVNERLEPYGFVRIHRSTIVNEALVEEIRVSTSGEMFLRVKGIAREYNISHKYKSAVRLFASCWI